MRRIIKAITGGDDAADLTARIEATKAEATQAFAEIERLETERRSAETFEAACAIDDEIARLRWAIDRADATLPVLEQQLADARWREREALFRRYRREISSAAKEAIRKVEAAAEANEALAQLRH